MFAQFTARISHFNRTHNMLDVNHDSVALPPVPFISEADPFDTVDLLNAEPTLGQPSNVDVLGEDVDDVQFPRLYLPTDNEAVSEPQGALDMLDAGASGNINGLPFESKTFDFPAIPTDWNSALFQHSSKHEVFQATQPVSNDGVMLDPQLFPENSFTVPSHLGMHLNDLWSLPELLVNMPQLSPLQVDSCSSSVTTTPEPITPPDFASPSFLSPVQDQPPSSTLWDPQPCLAMPTSSEDDTTRQVPMSPVKEKVGSSIKAGPSTSKPSSSGARSSSPTLPDQFYIQKPSSTGAQRSSRKKVESTVSQATKTRRSAKERNKHLPCTHEGCMETFYDNRVLRRHLRTVHENGSHWHCPGSCGKKYTRDDALIRHLNSVGEDSSCQIAARALGWHPEEKCSVQRLRVASA